MVEDHQFDRQKFKAAVHYVAASTRPEELGRVKLHKILYFADMLHYLAAGRPLTGEEYQKQQFGPTARHLGVALKELAAEGKLDVRRRLFHGFPKDTFDSLEEPRSDVFTQDELKLLADVIDDVCARSAREISEISHNAAWELASLGETLPYYTAYLMAPAEVTDDDVAWGAEEAGRILSAA